MFRLITVAVLFLTCLADPRSPRIYNVLISSKKNLSPSHAQPVYEPVLRTTSIGYAFPSLFYHSSFVQNVPVTYINPDYSGYRKVETSFLGPNREVTGDNVALPASTQQLQFNNNPIFQNQNNEQPQFNPYALNYLKYLPKDQQAEPGEPNTFPVADQEETDPKKVIANLKKNTGIPDVPPPPLPVRVPAKQ